MGDENDDINVLLTAATGNTEKVHDPVADAPSIINATHGLYNGSGSQIAAVPVQQPADANVRIERGQRNVSGTIVPLHRFSDPSTNCTYLEVQYSNDPVDGYPRVEVTSYPDVPHRETVQKYHPVNSSTIMASASSGFTTKTNSTEWPDLY